MKNCCFKLILSVVFLLIMADVHAQNVRVTGVVSDTQGPLIGVNVRVKDSATGVITDINGKYSLEVPSNSTLVFSYIGYLNQEHKVGNKGVINVVMAEDTKQLEEVVVVGYGYQRKSDVATSVASVKTDELKSYPAGNVADMLHGRVAGVNVTSTSGRPGSNPNITVRGNRSISASNTPLYVIDGSISDSEEFSTLSAENIESIEILKDAASQAIYGARASDGVILVTTKSGKRNQKTSVAFDAYYSIKTPALLRIPAKLLQHAEMALEITDGSFTPEYTRDQLDLIRQNSDLVLTDAEWGRWTGYPQFFKDQDWNDMLIGNGNMQNYNVNISGGGERYSYMLSLGHQREEGITKYCEDVNKRYIVRTKSRVENFKNLTYDLN